MAVDQDRTHKYHAEATALSGTLHHPLKQEIKPHAYVKIHEDGGYLAQQATEFQLESVLQYGRAHTQVSGNLEDKKPGHGWNTLTTSVVEGLNILNVITADRVVAQIATEHPLVGYIPRISFLGTHFVNLRIAGHPVNVDLDIEFIGEKPENDAPYTKSPGFVDRVCKQHARLREHPNPLAEILGRYNQVPESFGNSDGTRETVECSLIHKVESACPGRIFGHVIHIRDFGTIYLAQVKIEHTAYHPVHGIPTETHIHLDMIRAEMGCIATGAVSVGSGRVNGTTKP
jgi:hypothetical protein